MMAGFDGLTIYQGRVIRPHTSVALHRVWCAKKKCR
jgi:hypothetical protein